MSAKDKGAQLLMAHSDSALVSAFVAGYDMAKSSCGWVNEDELPDDYPYDAMYPFSKVDIVRMFPSPEFAAILVKSEEQNERYALALRNILALCTRPQALKSPMGSDIARNVERFCEQVGIRKSVLRGTQ